MICVLCDVMRVIVRNSDWMYFGFIEVVMLSANVLNKISGSPLFHYYRINCQGLITILLTSIYTLHNRSSTSIHRHSII